MNILVLGGSYFLGKHFVEMAAAKHNITVFNRGNRPLAIDGVKEIKGDRHDQAALKGLLRNVGVTDEEDVKYDAIVDLCAYNQGDIAGIFEALGETIKQYIFISTVDVYKRGLQLQLTEHAELEDRDFGGEVGQYILGKVALEKELVDCAKKYGALYTSIRPAFIYGKDNYAPREGIYLQWIQGANQIIHPKDATGEFQFVYVKDVAKAILNVIGNQDAFNQAYNLAAAKIETYETYYKMLCDVFEREIEKVPVSLETVYQKNIPLPFPLTKEESNYYSGEKARRLIGEYTSLVDGMKETIQ